MLFGARGIRHLRTEPDTPPTGDKLERFHQNMAREWAHRVIYASSRHRPRALRYWIHHYNERRPHSAAAGQVPIGRVRCLWRNDIERRWAGLATSQTADMNNTSAAGDPPRSGTSEYSDATGA
jgi:hypothetical protein